MSPSKTPRARRYVADGVGLVQRVSAHEQVTSVDARQQRRQALAGEPQEPEGVVGRDELASRKRGHLEAKGALIDQVLDGDRHGHASVLFTGALNKRLEGGGQLYGVVGLDSL